MTQRELQSKRKDFIKSPLNYTGGKHKLLSQILPLFPSSHETFIDLFVGGCNVCVNAEARKYIANDKNLCVIELFRYFKSRPLHSIKNEIESVIDKYSLSRSTKYGYRAYGTNSQKGLSAYNKENYLRLRDDYNKNPSPALFFTLIIYAFNNQIRFSKKGEFNLGVNKRDFSLNMQKNLELFVTKLQSIDIEFSSLDFRELKVSKNTFVYADPPYLIGTASYNESGLWGEKDELDLLSYLDALDANEVRFALSNLLKSKGKTNEILLEWSKAYKVHQLKHSYRNCNYQTKDKKSESLEVLITNY